MKRRPRALALAWALGASLCATTACSGGGGADAGDAAVEAATGCAPDNSDYTLVSVYESGSCSDAGASSTLHVRRHDAGEGATVEASGADTFVCEGAFAGCDFSAACSFGTLPDTSSLELALRFTESSLEGTATLRRDGTQPCNARYRLQGVRR